MLENQHITVLIPAYNEEKAIGLVIDELKSISHHHLPMCDDILVINNHSTDDTAQVAIRHGATVIHEQQKGYGAACLAGIKAIKNTDIILFVDGDHSSRATDMLNVCKELKNADLVIGSRTLGLIEKNAMTKIQKFGTAFICWFIGLRYKTSITDLGPLRAIRHSELLKLNMRDQRYGWTAEMQIKAIKKGLIIKEVAVTTKVRVGHSKISGTWKGTILASIDLLKHTFIN